MAKNFKELQAKMSSEARIRSEEAAEKMISEMGLAELREAMDDDERLSLALECSRSCRHSVTRLLAV